MSLKDQAQYISIKQLDQHHSHELSQKLSFFVVGIEVVFCGYMLLIAEKLIGVDHIGLLFLASGIAAISGIIYRFIFNQQIYISVHDKVDNHPKGRERVRRFFYLSFILFSFIFFIGLLTIGYSVLKAKEDAQISTPSINKQTIDRAINK